MISVQSTLTLFALFVCLYILVAYADEDPARRVRQVNSKNGSLVLMMENGFLKATVDCTVRQNIPEEVKIPALTSYPRFFTQTHTDLRKVLKRKCIPDNVLVKGMSEGVRFGPFGGPMLMPVDSAIHFDEESDGQLVPKFKRSMELASDIRDMGWDDDMMIVIDVPRFENDLDVVLLMHVGAFLDRVADETMNSEEIVDSVKDDCDWYSRRFYINDASHAMVHVCEIRKVYKLIVVESIQSSPVKRYSEPECPICLQEYSESSDTARLSLECGHCFHKQCMSIWTQAACKCPICRGEAPIVNV